MNLPKDCLMTLKSLTPLLLVPLFGLGSAQAAEPLAHTVTAMRVTDTLAVDGTVEAINKATLTAQTQGRVTAIHFDVDDYVEQGEVVIELENREQKARVSQAQAAVEEARASVDEASRNFARVEELVSSGTLSQADFDRSKAALDAARARQKQTEAALDQARQQLSYTQLAAPYPGILTERYVEVGELATPGKPLVAGLSMDRIRVTATVPQRYVDAVRRQSSLTVVLDDGTRLASNDITVFPYAEAGSHSFRIRAELDAGVDGIYPGMFARVELATGERDVLTVPTSALLRRQELTAVYRLVGGSPRLTQVRTGRVLAEQVEILAGLAAGDTIAVDAAAVPGQLAEGRE